VQPPETFTKALEIVVEIPPWYGKYSPDIAWLFFATDYGRKVHCRMDTVHIEKRIGDLSKPAYPGGTFDLKLFGEDCQYKNNGINPGRLFCGDKEIECKNDLNHKDGIVIGPKLDGSNYMCGPSYRQAMFTREW
jgi:hypothetical protein